MSLSKLLIVSNMYPTAKTPSYGVFVKNIERQLEQHGFDVDKLVIRGREKSYIRKLFKYLTFLLCSCWRLLFTQRVVYVHFIAHSSIPILLISLIRNLSIVSHVHGGEVMRAAAEPAAVFRIKRWLSKKIMKRSRKIIVPSNFFKQLLSDEYGIADEKIFVSPSGGVDTRSFTPAKDLKKLDTIKQFGYVGRLDQGKGVDTLLRAFALQYVENKNVRLKVVGNGDLYPQLTKLAQELGIQSVVSFEGVKGQQALISYYQEFDFLVFPTELQESLGLVGLESMACGTPVIGSCHGGLCDYIFDGQNGFMFRPGDVNELATVMTNAIGISSTEYANLAQHSRRTAMLFDAQSSSKSLASMFATIGK